MTRPGAKDRTDGELMPLTPWPGIDLDSINFSKYFRSTSLDFGIKLFTRGPRSVPEHSHENIQISIPLGPTVAHAAWRSSSGALKHAIAHHGHALVIPAQKRHAIAWTHRAYFANLHLSAALACKQRAGLLRVVDRAGEAHLIADPFLARLGEIIATMAAQKYGLDESTLVALSAVVQSHLISPYTEARQHLESCGRLVQDSARRRTNELSPAQLRAVTAAVRDDLARNWTVDELAARVGRSIGHFSRAFRSTTGSPPRQWIIQRRIERALDRLARTADGLAIIAQDCGFNDQAHFTRTFTRVIGTSPGVWRRQHAVR